tara:strand:- start:1603 stop:1773 length:171 start_codon:yes stop_codon:yes gene_type:complete
MFSLSNKGDKTKCDGRIPTNAAPIKALFLGKNMRPSKNAGTMINEENKELIIFMIK